MGIFIGVNAQDLNERFKLTLEKCFMTPDDQFDNEVQYTVIENKCVASDEVKYVEVIENGVSSQARLSVQSFMFNDDESDSDMFVHCRVRICDSETENCDLTDHCSSRKRRTADIFEARQARLKEIRKSMNLFDEAEQTNEVEERK